ncbi:MAG: hypothetical protein ACD_73C00343G0001 [uncultured bacterium]|nr:MAG: hypothetical protein ACD_73C00343G0001 [uncultured bacterium]
MKKQFLILCLLALTVACGGAASSDSSGNTDNSANTSQTDNTLGTKLNLTYNFKIQVSDSGGVHEPYVFPQEYTTPLYVKSNGTVTLRAKDYPRMVLRICPTSSARSDCDIKVNTDDDIGSGIDLTLDLCGINNSHSQCGDGDTTNFAGLLASDGSLTINAVAVRVRVFYLNNDGPTGYSASDTATGFVSDLPRITASIRTNPDIISGGLKAFGQKVTDTDITLIAGGVIPSDMPDLGDASYIVTMEGIFDEAPLDLII